jgi:hypothetical protein
MITSLSRIGTKTSASVAVSAAMIVHALAADAYTCTANQVVGVAPNQVAHQWEPFVDREPTTKHYLKKANLGWAWADAKDSLSGAEYCNTVQGVMLYCHNSIDDVRIDLRRLRYQVIWPLGFAYGPQAFEGKDGAEFPNIEIGYCTPQ